MTLDWHTEYARALAAFGFDTPSPTLEQDILDAFQEHPQAVSNAITKIGKAYQAGKIHSPWGALKAEIPKQIDHTIRVGDGNERNRMIAAAERWLSNAGHMYDRWAEIDDELFGDREFAKGCTLHPWRRDKALRERMSALWIEVRTIGEQIERDELVRAETWKANRDHLGGRALPEEGLKRLRELAASRGAPTAPLPPLAT